MKKMILKITAVSLFAATLAFLPTTLCAQDTNTPAMSDMPVKHKKHEVLPFHGKLAAVDTNAMTLTVGTRTFEITSDTKISKADKPATLADGVVGEMVGGAYKKGTDGKLTATSIRFGLKSEVKKKKKANADTAVTSTNNVPN
jgi:hypothetical protein